MDQKSCITLIGMPGAGKSTLGVVLAKIINYNFIDADLLIQNQSDKTLQKIIDALGPEGFIEVENEVLSTLEAQRSVIATTWGFDVFISSLFASAFAAIYSEVIAKIRKAPTTLFLIISVVVLIPGGSLYYTMSYAVQKKWAEAAAYGSQTLQCALGLAIGMSLIWIFHDMARKVYYLIH